VNENSQKEVTTYAAFEEFMKNEREDRRTLFQLQSTQNEKNTRSTDAHTH
jgi:hypothetical protein